MLFDLMSKCIHCIFVVYMRQSCRKDMIQWWIKCECQLESGTKFTVLKAVT